MKPRQGLENWKTSIKIQLPTVRKNIHAQYFHTVKVAHIHLDLAATLYRKFLVSWICAGAMQSCKKWLLTRANTKTTMRLRNPLWKVDEALRSDTRYLLDVRFNCRSGNTEWRGFDSSSIYHKKWCWDGRPRRFKREIPPSGWHYPEHASKLHNHLVSPLDRAIEDIAAKGL